MVQKRKNTEKRVDIFREKVYNVVRLVKANSMNFLFWRIPMNLREAREGEEYEIKSILPLDSELSSFLFSLGCYAGEKIAVVTRQKRGCIIALKGGRYSIDNQLAEAILV